MVNKYTFVAIYKEDLGMKPRHYEQQFEAEGMTAQYAWIAFWSENDLDLIDSVVFINHQKNV